MINLSKHKRKSLYEEKKKQRKKRAVAIVSIMLSLLMSLSGCTVEQPRSKNNCIYSVVTYGQALDCLKELHESQ